MNSRKNIPKEVKEERLSEDGTLSVDLKNISNFKTELEDVFREIKMQQHQLNLQDKNNTVLLSKVAS